jgi:hypothetical protein
MNDSEKKLIHVCIESHRRMIVYHRRQIIELYRKTIKESNHCIECFDFEVINESGRSDKDQT